MSRGMERSLSHGYAVCAGRNLRAWGVVIASALLVILIAAVFLQSRGSSSQPFQMDDLYGLLD
jgi:hypothetical protein